MSRGVPSVAEMIPAWALPMIAFGKSNWPVCRYSGMLTDPVDFEIHIWESFMAQQLEGRADVMYKNALRVYGPGSSSHK